MRYKRGGEREKERWEGATERAVRWSKRVERNHWWGRKMLSVKGSDRHDG